ncbi:hypothetical protein A2U01_0026195, partial [Trifolium medium]|nr:hypothetical protein [Trifolium medium]
MNLAAYIFHQLCTSIKFAQNPKKKTPQIAYPRLLSEIFNQCGLIRNIKISKAVDLLEEQRASFINGTTLTYMKLVTSKKLKYPTHPLLKEDTKIPASDNTAFLFSNEPPETSKRKEKEQKKKKEEEPVKEKTFGKTTASGAGASEVKTISEKVGGSEGKDSEKGKVVASVKQPATEGLVQRFERFCL